MKARQDLWDTPLAHLASRRPDAPVAYFCPPALARQVARFRAGFPGELTYAVKANPHRAVLDNLMAAGLRAFDVASPREMDMVRAAAGRAVLHYNNPVRSPAEIAHAKRLGVASYSVDDPAELDKLAAQLPPGSAEIAVRFKLPIKGAHYDFGGKFGAEPAAAVQLLRRVAQLGCRPALSFHPGTQCPKGEVWAAYIAEAAAIARRAGVTIGRLNVGGGFPSHRKADAPPDPERIFRQIAEAVAARFGPDAPQLLCEPGRGLVADSFALATRIKAIRPDGAIFLNDGIYGGLAECAAIGPVDRLQVFSPRGEARGGPLRARETFGPTCDSIDRLPEPLNLPAGSRPGDYVLFQGLGAYSLALASRFNGYGDIALEMVARLEA